MARCTYDPTPLLGQPMGMFHCPECGCMVIAGMEHGECDPDLCGLEQGFTQPPLWDDDEWEDLLDGEDACRE